MNYSISSVRTMSVKDKGNGTLTAMLMISMTDGKGFTKSDTINYDFLSTDTYEQQQTKANTAANAYLAKFNS